MSLEAFRHTDSGWEFLTTLAGLRHFDRHGRKLSTPQNSRAALTLVLFSLLAAKPASATTQNGIVYVDGTATNLNQGISACPSGTGGCHIVVTAPLSFDVPVIWSNDRSPLILECIGGSDQNKGGTLLTFRPKKPASALTIANSSQFVFRNCGLTQGNNTPGVNGIVYQGVQGASIENSKVFGFTGVGLWMNDYPSASAIRNGCSNSWFFDNGTGLLLSQTNPGKAVNGNTFTNCHFYNNRVIQVKATGNASENVFTGGDLSGETSPLAQLGDNNTYCRSNSFFGTTMEGGLAAQTGILNACQAGFFILEGGLTGAGATPVLDNTIAGASHLYIQGSGLPNKHGAGWDSTLPGLKFNVLGNLAGGSANPQPDANGSVNFASPWCLYASGACAAQVTDTGLILRSYTFATLPPAGNGTVVYCSNCNATCTAGSGRGRTCFRENGAWTH